MDWQQRWIENKTAWDLGKPHPLTEELLKLISLDQAQIWKHSYWLIPGCGRCHDHAPLIQRGARVLGVDLSTKAIEEARQCYEDVKNLSLEAIDIFDLEKKSPETFHGVFDRAVLCALPRQERVKYINSVFKMLRPGGHFVSIPFAEVRDKEQGPPFQVDEKELRDLFKGGWEILHLEQTVSPACDQKIIKEWRFIARKQSV